MKRLLLALTMPFVLAGCGSSTVTYRLSFDLQDTVAQTALLATSMNVIQARLDTMKAIVIAKTSTPDASGATVKLTLNDSALANALTSQLVAPFTLRIMKEVESGSQLPNVLVVNGQGTFAETGITEKDITGGQAAEDNKKMGAIKIDFTPEGKAKFAEVLKQNVGKNIGIFVRDRLISRLSVQSADVQDYIVIRNIKNADIARIFVDDLNVGLHVTFTPLP